jgi:hypothetical protein
VPTTGQLAEPPGAPAPRGVGSSLWPAARLRATASRGGSGRSCPSPPLQVFTGAMCVYPLLQAANLRSTIDLDALPPGMDGMAALQEVRAWRAAGGPPLRPGCCHLGPQPASHWLAQLKGVRLGLARPAARACRPGLREGSRPSPACTPTSRPPPAAATAPALALPCRPRRFWSAYAPASRATCWSCRWTPRWAALPPCHPATLPPCQRDRASYSSHAALA